MDQTHTSLDNLLADFDAHLARERLRAPRTVNTYTAIARQFARHCGGSPATAHATPQQIQQFLGLTHNATGDIAQARSRWNLHRAALRAWYAFLASRGLCHADPTAIVPRQRVPRRDPQPLTMQELVALVAAVRRHSPAAYQARNVAIVQTAIHTALRVSELTGLDATQVDLQGGVIGAVRRKGGKVSAAWLNGPAIAALSQWLAERARLHPADGEPALFLAHTGARMAPRTVQEMVSKYAKLAGIRRRVTPHLLRHSAATALAALGTPIRTLQEVLAHSSVATTQLYVTVAAQDRIDAAARLGAAFEAAVAQWR